MKKGNRKSVLPIVCLKLSEEPKITLLFLFMITYVPFLARKMFNK